MPCLFDSTLLPLCSTQNSKVSLRAVHWSGAIFICKEILCRNYAVVEKHLLYFALKNYTKLVMSLPDQDSDPRPPALAPDDGSALCRLLAHQHVLSWNYEDKYLVLAETGVSDMELTLHKCL